MLNLPFWEKAGSEIRLPQTWMWEKPTPPSREMFIWKGARSSCNLRILP